jgi:hypothetical protein
MKYLYKKIKSMRQLFKIDESEKKRILEMHENATKRNYLSEQPTPTTTTPPQQPSGPEINGKTYKIENITDDKSLNKFLNWGTDVNNPEIATTKFYTPNMSYLMGLRSADKAVDLNDPLTLEEREVLKKVTEDLDTIAQNYTLSEVCSQTPKSEVTLNNSKSLYRAKTRAEELGWCKTQSTPPGKSELKRQAAQDKFKQQQPK